MPKTAKDTHASSTSGLEPPKPRPELLALSRSEWATIGLAILLWAGIFLRLSPPAGATDAYLFRDAAINFAHGRGFQTASFEHSASFKPELYSSYTPGSLWAFIPISWAFRNAELAAQVYTFLLSSFALIIAATLALPAVPQRKLRAALLVGMIAVFPVGFVGGASERPEALSFIGLLVLLKVLTLERQLVPACLLGGLLFLAQPFAGLVAAALIATATLIAQSWDRTSFARMLRQGALIAAAFVLPVAITALTFYYEDNTSLQRFLVQAKVGGIDREVSTKVSGEVQSSPPKSLTRPSLVQKYKRAALFQLALGPLGLLAWCGGLVAIVIWLCLVAAMRGNFRSRLSLFCVGCATLLLPLVLAPLQGNYLLLGRTLLPFCLLLNFADCRTGIRPHWAPTALLAVNLSLLLPITLITILTRYETKPSFEREQIQAHRVHQYLKSMDEQDKVVVVPATHYFLYKTLFNNIFNPEYLSSRHDLSEIAAVVNCPTASLYFDARAKPLDPVLRPQAWTEFDAEGNPVAITVLGRQITRRNWSWGCVVFVRGHEGSDR